MKENKKTISLVCLTCHFFITFIVNCSNYIASGGFMNVMGAIASTIGLSVVVIVTYLLLYFKKINTIGAIIGLSLQVISSVGQRISHYAIAENENYVVLGIASGIGLNLFFVCSLYFLLNTQNIARKETIALNANSVHFQDEEQTVGMIEVKGRQGHFDFSSEEGEANKQLRKLMKIPEQESIIRMGEIKSKGVSFFYVLMTGLFYVAFIVLSILTQTEGKSYSGVFAPIEYRILGIEIAYKYGFKNEYTLTSGLGIYIFICIVVLVIPIAIYLYQRWQISATKFVLTEKKLYVFDSRKSVPKAIIPLSTIKNIDFKPNFYISDAKNIIITNTANGKVKIYGVRNANAFLNVVIEEYRKNGG